MANGGRSMVSAGRFRSRAAVASVATVFTLMPTVVLAAPPAPSVAATRCEGVSMPRVPVVVELYTSEGCNSCPPADRWLSRALARQRAADEAPFIALAFHVDYWDYLGWKDMFAQPAFTQRQAVLARNGSVSGVYTPQTFVNGRDDRSWTRGITTLPASTAAATVQFGVSARWTADGVDIRGKHAAPIAPVTSVRLRYAVTENGLTTAVKAGENRGETLRHDAVVRAHGSMNADASGAFATTARLPAEVRRNASQLHVIAEDTAGKPLAAVTLACAGT